MKLSVAHRFTAPTRTLAVLALGAALGGIPQAAYSQQAPLPDETAQTAQAVPDAANAPRAQATDLAAAAALQAKTSYGGGARLEAGQNRAVARRASLEGRMRELMARSGVTATSTQDAILTFLREDEESKRTVREAGRKLWNALRRDAPAERVRALLTDYQKALKADQVGRVRSQTALDARVGYSLNPRLESVLWLLGVLGEGQNILVLPPPQPFPTQPLRGPRIAGVGGNAGVGPEPPFGGMGTAPLALAAVEQTTYLERNIEGTVNAKNAPDETLIWLEVRDKAGQLWRLLPSNAPDARPILNRQIDGLKLGARVMVRVAASDKTDRAALLPLLAIVPLPDDAQNQYRTNADGANPVTNGP